MNSTYPSNLSDTEWECLQQFLPTRSPRGRLRRHSLRSVFDALFYVLRTGCPWRYLPSNFPPWQTVYYHKRHLLVDTLGLPLYFYVTPANVHDTVYERKVQTSEMLIEMAMIRLLLRRLVPHAERAGHAVR